MDGKSIAGGEGFLPSLSLAQAVFPIPTDSMHLEVPQRNKKKHSKAQTTQTHARGAAMADDPDFGKI
jgi:hypothetical protein